MHNSNENVESKNVPNCHKIISHCKKNKRPNLLSKLEPFPFGFEVSCDLDMFSYL